MLTKRDHECALGDSQLDLYFKEKSAAATEGLRRHLQECERCRPLYSWILEAPADANREPDLDRPELYRRIGNNLASAAAPVRALPSSAVLVVQFGALLSLFAGAAVLIVGTEGLGQMNLAQMLGMGAILGLSAALVSFSLVWQMIPGSLHRYRVDVILPVLAAGYLLGIALLFRWLPAEAFLERGWYCLKTGMLLSSTGAFLFWIFARRGATPRFDSMGATLGAAAGLVGVTALQFACVHQDLGHLMVWHGAVLLTSIVLGLLMARAARILDR